MNRFGVFDADQLLIQAAIEVAQVVRVESQLIQNGRVNSANMQRILYCFSAQFIGRPVRDATLDAATSHPHGEAVRVVISSGTLSYSAVG